MSLFQVERETFHRHLSPEGALSCQYEEKIKNTQHSVLNWKALCLKWFLQKFMHYWNEWKDGGKLDQHVRPLIPAEKKINKKITLQLLPSECTLNVSPFLSRLWSGEMHLINWKFCGRPLCLSLSSETDFQLKPIQLACLGRIKASPAITLMEVNDSVGRLWWIHWSEPFYICKI